MTEKRMTLIERLRNPAWEADPNPDPRGASHTPARLNIEQTRATMNAAADELESLQESLDDALHPNLSH